MGLRDSHLDDEYVDAFNRHDARIVTDRTNVPLGEDGWFLPEPSLHSWPLPLADGIRARNEKWRSGPPTAESASWMPLNSMEDHHGSRKQ